MNKPITPREFTPLQTVKIFKSGNSVAVRLPASLGFEAGTELALSTNANGDLKLDKTDQPKRKFNIEKVLGCAIGSGIQFIKDEDRAFEVRPLLWDDSEWRTKYMPGE